MRIAHTMIRVGNLEKSIQFYTDVLGMQIIKRKDYPEGRFTLVFVGYGPEPTTALIELTYNWDTSHYDIGNGFGHIALHVSDIYGLCQLVTHKGGKVTRAPGAMKHGTTVIAFIEDPDGYKIELIERGA
ncbi:MAG: lactoylglutathione lyase [Gammaproteobacteria bacterium]|nr:lactoylglutathione lyase [Gammaproteobacteria bacterium]